MTAVPRQENMWRARSRAFQKRCRHLWHWNAACLRCWPLCFKALCSELVRLPHTWHRRRAWRPEVLGGCLMAWWSSKEPCLAYVVLGQIGQGKRLIGISIEVSPLTLTAPPDHDFTLIRPLLIRNWARSFFLLTCACSFPLRFLRIISFRRVSLLRGTPTSFPSLMML